MSRTESLSVLEQQLDYRFSDPTLLSAALTHPGAAQHAGGPHGYERLEFLGDRVLGLAVADLLLARYPRENEGALTRRLTALVRRESLLVTARAIGLDRFIRTSAAPGERERDTALADGCEALIGAIYLDGGLGAAERFVHRAWAPLVEVAGEVGRDPKSALQEWAQGRGRARPIYEIVAQDGPAHRPSFTVEVRLQDLPSATGTGASRREAEQAAAAALSARLEADGRD